MSIITYFVSVYCGYNFFHFNLENKLLTSSKVNFLAGSFIGIVIAFIDFVLTWVGGFIQISKINKLKISEILQIFFGMFLTGVTEEIIYRGILIGFLLSYVPVWIALLISSIIFSYGHLQYSWMYALSAFSGGIVLGIAFLSYGIYCSIGLHMFFNFVETFLYSIFDIKVKNKLIAGERKTPDDGGIFTFLIELFFICIYFYFYFLSLF
jgi:membrane protease YdiL (CAAX protease family)